MLKNQMQQAREDRHVLAGKRLQEHVRVAGGFRASRIDHDEPEPARFRLAQAQDRMLQIEVERRQ